MADLSMVIDGKPVTADDRIPVENPATEEPIGSVPACTSELLDAAVAAAGLAQSAWAALGWAERATRIRDCGRALEACLPDVARLLTLEQGKPLAQARAEVELSARWFGQTADLVLATEVLVDDQAAEITLDRVPLGVAAAITPFNFPVILAVVKLAPALLAGNTVVLKPSPDTPLSSLAMVAALQDALPPGVLNVVCGGRELGERLVGHEQVRKVSFTGSVPAGRAIARLAGEGLKPVTLELGGNDAALVLPGTDPAAVAADLFWAAMVNAGQFCAAVKRVYVHAGQAGALCEALRELADTVRVGDGLDPKTEIGPLTSARQRDRVADLVERARADGARVCAGGAPPGGRRGHFYRPTIVTDLAVGSPLECEEQFGPALPVIAYDDLEHAVARANAGPFGLGASVWGDPERAVGIAAAMRAGTVWVNKHGDLRHDAPFGGVGCSGIGVEYGIWGLLEYTRPRVVNVRTGTR